MRSSAGEHHVHTVGVVGSNPTASTTSRRRGRSTYVYFVRAVTLGLIKIGRATDPEQRFSGLQTGSPDKLELLGVVRSDDAEQLEGHLHARFSEARRHGEWFEPAPALLAYVEEHAFTWREETQRLIFEAYEHTGLKAGDGEMTRAGIRELLARLDAQQIVPVAPGPRQPRDRPYPKGRKAALARYKAARGIAG